MNLLLLDPAEVRPDGTAVLTDRRARHVTDVLRAGVGDRLQVGVVNGPMGAGEVLSSTAGELVLRVTLDRDPPPRAPIDLLLAVPRPKILRRVLQAVASMGLGKLVLLGSYRVEKSYFGSPALEPAAIAAELRLGLEQGRDTQVPEVSFRRFFKPFVEDELDTAFGPAQRLLADPVAEAPLGSIAPAGPRAVVAIGPEGGWTRYEAETLTARGFAPFTLGPRVLRVDAAVPYVAGQVALWLRKR